MTKNAMADKLAQGVRRARDSKPAKSPKSAPSRPAPAATGFARQSDQSPPASLDRPWVNLHPERIWPD